MRATAPLLILLLTGLAAAPASAQTPKGTKAPAGPEIRYFTYLNGLIEDRGDVVLKETRQGGRVVAASLDVCFPMPSDAEPHRPLRDDAAHRRRQALGLDPEPGRQAGRVGQPDPQGERQDL